MITKKRPYVVRVVKQSTGGFERVEREAQAKEQTPKRPRYLRGNNPNFFVILPIDVIVSILAQNPRLLGMAHYLSKDIAKKARPVQLRILAHKPFTYREMRECREPFAIADTQPIQGGKMHVRYASYFLEDTIWRLAVGPSGVIGTMNYKLFRWSKPFGQKPPCATHQPDLHTSILLHQRRGQDDALRLVKETLEDRYKQKRTLGQVVSLHAFLLIHMIMLGDYRKPFIVARLNGDMDASWQSVPGAHALIKDIDAWYEIVKHTL